MGVMSDLEILKVLVFKSVEFRELAYHKAMFSELGASY